MTPQEQKVVELANKIEELNKQRKELQSQLDSEMLELGIGYVFKSDEGLVYQIQYPTGTYVEYKRIAYARTKRDNETKGSLSKSEAEKLMALKG